MNNTKNKEIVPFERLEMICKDIGWECDFLLEMVILALLEKRFRVLAPTNEEWARLREQPDVVDLLSKRLSQHSRRQWEQEEVIAFKNQIELEFLRPARTKISFETQIQLLFNKDQTCAVCGSKGADMIPEIDHRQPVRKGGSSEYRNLQWACRSCNRKKQAKVGKEWKNA